VLQNRFFLKKMRPEVNLFGGQVLNEPYSQTWMLGGRAGVFLTETLGAEYTFTSFSAKDSEDLKALRKIKYCKDQKVAGAQCVLTNTEPSFVRLKGGHTLTGTFAPIYGKVNLMEGYILYSDIYANIGAGILSTSQGSKNAFVVGFGQRLYFAESFNVRIDAVDHIFQEERDNLGKTQKSTRHAWTVSLGVSAFLLD
jgi:outer membrane beta-barrel protein